MMLTTPNEDGIMLNDEQMKDNVNNMLFAGHETSSSTMAVALKYLYLNPECLKKVIQGALLSLPQEVSMSTFRVIPG